MKRPFYCLLFLTLLALPLIFTIPVSAQNSNDKDIDAGTEYWLGLPNCRRQASEPIRNGEYPIMLWLSSKVNTTATVTADAIGFTKTVQITKNVTTIVELGDQLMNTESEKIENFGIHVKANDPVTVCVYYSYKWSGEAYRGIPIEWLGKKYVTTNLYLDKTDEFKPPEILVIATEDGTNVTYYPKAHTVKCNAGSSRSVTMKKGQTMLIEGRIAGYEGLAQDFVTDLTGTYIEANKPIAVVTGHTKGAFPRYFMGTRGGWMEPTANFSRNMLTEMLWPIELLGSDYITAPLKYRNRPRNLTIVGNDAGDMVRLVAAYDGTDIYQIMTSGASKKINGNPLKRGQEVRLESLEDPALFHATKPFLCAQYGKTWWHDDGMMGPITQKKDEGKGEIQNPYNNGQGMLVLIAPMDHWCGYAQFRSPVNVDNWVYITFVADDVNKIRFDGSLLSAKFGTSIKPIGKTKYTYVMESIGAGDHYVEADSGVKFACYAYGNWDYEKDGFAYGYPTGINYASPCVDSLYVLDNTLCGDVKGGAFVVPEDSSCAILFNITYRASDSYNYDPVIDDFDRTTAKTAGFKLNIIDIKDSAKGVISFLTRSGKMITKTYTYQPEKIEVTPKEVNFGSLQINETKTLSFRVTNVGKVTAHVKQLRLKLNKTEFKLNTSEVPFDLEVGQYKDISVDGTALAKYSQWVVDSVIAVLSCYEETVAALKLTSGQPVLWIGDANWGQLPIGKEYPMNVEMRNEGQGEITVTSIDWPDKVHFTRTDLTFPLTIAEGRNHTFTVWYLPDVPGVVHQTRANFTATCTERKLYSDWIGEGLDVNPFIVGFDWQKRRVIDNYSINKLGINNYVGNVVINCKGNEDISIVSVTPENVFGGVFSLDATDLAKMPQTLKHDSSYTIRAYFAPKTDAQDAIEDYQTNVVFTANFSGTEKVVKGVLHGSEMQPHIDITGHDFGPPILINKSINGAGQVKSFSKTPLTAMPLTIDSLWIEGTDAKSFTIDPQFFIDHPTYPIVLPADVTPLDVPIIFTARHEGQHVAYLKANHDAPEDPAGKLIGEGKSQGMKPGDYAFPTIFITTSDNGEVWLTNTGSDALQVNDMIKGGADQNEFMITSWRTTTANNPAKPITLVKGDTLFVNVQFIPTKDRQYSAQVIYKTDQGDTLSKVTGAGKLIWVSTHIPTDYQFTHPAQIQQIEVFLDNNEKNKEPLVNGKVTSFISRVYFDTSTTANVMKTLYPDVKGPGDITTGSMTNGWTVSGATIIADRVLEVTMQGTTPLSGTGTLFKFPMRSYLSDTSTIWMPVGFQPINKPYIFVDSLPGKSITLPVCVNTLRLVKMTGVNYALYESFPNPVQTKATINYSIGLDAFTSIVLYNSFGDRVATLVEKDLPAGNYELKIDINGLDLPSGVYSYRLQSGPYSETKQMVITR